MDIETITRRQFDIAIARACNVEKRRTGISHTHTSLSNKVGLKVIREIQDEGKILIVDATWRYAIKYFAKIGAN